jgi:hypothetical protein
MIETKIKTCGNARFPRPEDWVRTVGQKKRIDLPLPSIPGLVTHFRGRGGCPSLCGFFLLFPSPFSSWFFCFFFFSFFLSSLLEGGSVSVSVCEVCLNVCFNPEKFEWSQPSGTTEVKIKHITKNLIAMYVYLFNNRERERQKERNQIKNPNRNKNENNINNK